MQSVLGPVEAEDLGFVLAHEHVVAASPGIIRTWPSLFGGRPALLERGVRALAAAKVAGVNSIVDCTTFDCGRDVGVLVEVARTSGVNIFMSTGVWLDPSVTLRARTEAQLGDLFISELLDGVDGTSSRAAVIKIAHDAVIDEMGGRILRAAARACVTTNAPIITHTAAAHRTGEAQAAQLEDCGVDPARVAIGHSDDSGDIEYLSGLAARGYYIAMDRLPCGELPEYGRPVADRIEMIVNLISRGFADRILVGHDDPIWAGLLTDRDQQRHLEANPRQLAFISEVVVPALSSAGISEATIDLLTTVNPRRWLTGE